MGRFFFLILSIIFCLPHEAWSESILQKIPPPAEVKLPQDLLDFLHQKYPGFRIAEKKDYCSNFPSYFQFVSPNRWSYGALSADFNGDQLEDYSLIIKSKNKFLWLAALKNKKGKVPYEVKVLGPPMIWGETTQKKEVRNKICDGVFLMGDAHKIGPSEKDKEKGSNPYPYIGIENASSAIQFYWKDGDWHQWGYEP
jgi:hypothetical protein